MTKSGIFVFVLFATAILFVGCEKLDDGDTQAVTGVSSMGQSGGALNVIPLPAKMERGQGYFVLDAGTVICADKELMETGRFLAGVVKPATGFDLEVKECAGKSATGKRIILSFEADDGLGNEGYRLSVKGDVVRISAPKAAGVFYGCQTLRQLLPNEIESRGVVSGIQWSVPVVEIEDKPRFMWRGSLLDSCRHIQSVEFVKKYIDMLAYHKMNRLHWHLTEDQGWRIEIKKYPKLTEIGAWRDTPEGGKYGGFFTQEQIKDVVAYAKSRHVLVVPEIEMPGHSVAAVTCYPELSCTGGPFKVRTAWGISEDVYCAGNDDVFAFLEDVLDETMELFDSPWIHIGGDECPKTRWSNCEKCQARIKAEGLADEHELQSYFIKRIENYLNSKGRRLVGWDEILEGGLSPNATVQSWRGMQGGTYAAGEGHDVIMSPTSHCYLDYSYDNISVERAYSFEPVPENLSADKVRHILGLEGNLWAEWMPTEERVEYQAFPRICSLSEVAWSPKHLRSWDDFSARLSEHLIRLGLLGVKYYIPKPYGFGGQSVFLDEVTVEIKNAVAGSIIRYTTDGSDPMVDSPVYTEPIVLKDSAVVKASTFMGTSQSEPQKGAFRKEKLRQGVEAADAKAGVKYDYLEGKTESINDFGGLEKKSSGVIEVFALPEGHREEAFAVEFNGFIKAAADGIYTFYTTSDDGSGLWIGDTLVVDNDGPHGMVEGKGQAALGAGVHPVKVRFFEIGGGQGLEVRYEGPGIEKQIVPASVLMYE